MSADTSKCTNEVIEIIELTPDKIVAKCGNCKQISTAHKAHYSRRAWLQMQHDAEKHKTGDMNFSAAIDFDDPKAPTQAQFNEYHKEPIDYGEDGDQLLSAAYTKDEAVKIFKEHWEMLTGEPVDKDFESSVIGGSAGWSEDPDIDGGDYSFVMLNSGNTDTKARYEAWRLWV